jgi:transcriptional regulator of acetoin/glycerol metabolism
MSAMTEPREPTLSYALEAGAPRASFPPRPALVLLFECDRPTAASVRFPLDGVDVVRVGRGPARDEAREGRTLTLAVADRWMSTAHAELRREGGGFTLVDPGSKNGSFVGGARVRERALVDRDLVLLGHTLFVFRAALPDDGVRRAPAHRALATLVPALAARFAELAKVARSPLAVLLSGETGTGKEMTARAVHELSGRTGKLVAINCAALPAGLVESELFGHTKGAFSGAVADSAGVLRAAHKGTLLLDEVGDLPLPAQAALLRALEEKEVRPVGASAPVPVDVRVVAASHADLRAQVEDGRFRDDLLARLAGFTLTLPPLRERREDIGILFAALLASAFPERAERVALTPGAAQALARHAWPHNVRELRRVTERAMALADGDVLDVAHLPPELVEGAPAPAAPTKEELAQLLEEHRGNVSEIARLRGVTRMQVHRWMKRFGLEAGAFRG